VDLTNKVAIVTGGGRNVGQAVARRFVAEGARVAVVDLDPGRGKATADELQSTRPGSAQFFQCDVSSEGDVERMVREVVDTFGGVDVLVNNVAITDRGKTVLDCTVEEWHTVFAATVDSVFLCTKHAGRQMVEQGHGGAVVNIGSTSGHRGRTNVIAYAAAKGAVVNLTRALAAQLGPHGIRVNTVTPHRVGSPIGQDEAPPDRQRNMLLGRDCVAEDIANAVVFMASDEAGFVTAADLPVDGGVLHAGLTE